MVMDLLDFRPLIRGRKRPPLSSDLPVLACKPREGGRVLGVEDMGGFRCDIFLRLDHHTRVCSGMIVSGNGGGISGGFEVGLVAEWWAGLTFVGN